MEVNKKELYNKVSNSLINLDRSHNYLKYDQLFTLYDSVINNQPNKKSNNFKINNSLNSLTSKHNLSKQNLISQIINDKINDKRINLFHKSTKFKPKNVIKPKEKTSNNFKYNLNKNKIKTFLTSTYIQTNQPKSPEKDKVIHLGKSINDILIKNINDEMINKGILIQMPVSEKKNFNEKRNIKNNYNNYEKHMEIFEQKMKREFNDYLKEYKLAQKKSLKSVSKKIADKKEEMTKCIPIYIKGFKKNPIDIFHSRKIFDLEYTKYYRKPDVNIEEILHYQNKNGSNNFKKGKIPFYYFLRTVKNPYEKKSVSKKRPKSGKIQIEFKEEEKN
jgi:hypothetical protein